MERTHEPACIHKRDCCRGWDLAITAAATSAASAGTFDWKSSMTVAQRQRDEQGNLLPLQSYDERIRRGMSFLLDDHLKWFQGPIATITDEAGNVQMPWVYYSNVQLDGVPFPDSIDRFVSYPAFHHSLLIRTFIGHARYADDKRVLEEADRLADWNIAHSTPGDRGYGNTCAKTANVDTAAEGVRFDNAYSLSLARHPVRSALLTGQDIWRLRDAALFGGALHSRFDTCPPVPWEAGYEVAHSGKDRQNNYCRIRDSQSSVSDWALALGDLPVVTPAPSAVPLTVDSNCSDNPKGCWPGFTEPGSWKVTPTGKNASLPWLLAAGGRMMKGH